MQTDLELTTARRALQSTDKTIAALCRKFGDDIDKRPEYQAAENRRDRALELLANTRASSPAGMVAKARALKTLDDDLDRQAAIAASLADDVLRHLGRQSPDRHSRRPRNRDGSHQDA
jgi:hypothetical protein